MPSDFWSKKIAAVATPRPQQPPQTVASPGAWWQENPYAPSLRPQMPDVSPAAYAARAGEHAVRELLKIPADKLTAEQMEQIAEYELATKKEHNQACPNCGSGNFLPAGAVVHGSRMGSARCFECGGSSSAYTASPEPALGGSGLSRARRLEVRQIDTGGAAGSMYMQFDGVPAAYAPRT